MKCRTCRKEIDCSLDAHRVVTPQAEQHQTSCESCQAYRAGRLELMEALAGKPATEPALPPPRICENIMRAVRNETATTPLGHAVLWPAAAGGLAVMLLLLVVVSGLQKTPENASSAQLLRLASLLHVDGWSAVREKNPALGAGDLQQEMDALRQDAQWAASYVVNQLDRGLEERE